MKIVLGILAVVAGLVALLLVLVYGGLWFAHAVAKAELRRKARRALLTRALGQ